MPALIGCAVEKGSLVCALLHDDTSIFALYWVDFPTLKLTLPMCVSEVGVRGQMVTIKRNMFREVLQPMGLAVYASSESLERFAAEREVMAVRHFAFYSIFFWILALGWLCWGDCFWCSKRIVGVIQVATRLRWPWPPSLVVDTARFWLLVSLRRAFDWTVCRI